MKNIAPQPQHSDLCWCERHRPSNTYLFTFKVRHLQHAMNFIFFNLRKKRRIRLGKWGKNYDGSDKTSEAYWDCCNSTAKKNFGQNAKKVPTEKNFKSYP